MRRPNHTEGENKGEWTASVWIMQQQGLDGKGPKKGGAGSQNAYEGGFKPLNSFLSHSIGKWSER